MPIVLAMATAVIEKSLVTMKTRMPALRHVRITSSMPSLGLSMMPDMPTMQKSFKFNSKNLFLYFLKMIENFLNIPY